MAKADLAQYQVVKGMEIREFFMLYEFYIQDLKNKIKQSEHGR